MPIPNSIPDDARFLISIHLRYGIFSQKTKKESLTTIFIKRQNLDFTKTLWNSWNMICYRKDELNRPIIPKAISFQKRSSSFLPEVQSSIEPVFEGNRSCRVRSTKQARYLALLLYDVKLTQNPNPWYNQMPCLKRQFHSGRAPWAVKLWCSCRFSGCHLLWRYEIIKKPRSSESNHIICGGRHWSSSSYLGGFYSQKDSVS